MRLVIVRLLLTLFLHKSMSSFKRNDLLNAGKGESDGSIVGEIMSHNLKAVENDGTHNYGNVFREPENQNFPYTQGSVITFHLTSQKWHVDSFAQSFITATLQCKVNFSAYPAITLGSSTIVDELAKHQYIWVGLKASSHAIRQYTVWFNNQEISTSQQTQAVFEQFVYYALKSKEQLQNKAYRYSDYDEIQKMDNSMVGFYVSLYDIISGQGTVTKTFPIVIAYEDLMPFECFEVFPTALFGQIKIQMIMTNEGFVWCPVDITKSIKNDYERGLVDTTVITSSVASEILSIIPSTVAYCKTFEQQGVAAKMSFITAVDSTTYAPTITTYTDIVVSVSNVDVLSENTRTTIFGYMMTSAAMERLRYNMSNGAVFAIIGQTGNVQQLQTAPTDSSLNSTRSATFNHTTDVNLLFPTSAYSRTVFRNILARQFQLTIGDRQFPQQGDISTVSSEFYQMTMNATDFSAIFPPNDSFERSLTSPYVDDAGTRGTAIYEDTNFCPTFKLERPTYVNGSNVSFDGINAPSLNVRVNSVPIVSGDNPYGSGCPAPYLVCINEMYHIFRIVNGKPNYQYVVNHTYEEALANPSMDGYNQSNISYIN